MLACPDFWLNRPVVLLEDSREFFPFTEVDTRCTAAALNSFTRFGIYLGVVLAILRLQPLWLIVGVAFAAVAAGMWKYMETNDTMREGYAGREGYTGKNEGFLDIESPIVDSTKVNDSYLPDVIGSKGRTAPTAANPFMNVLMSEYTDSPLRYPATATGATHLDTYFDTMFARDPGDVFQKTQSQRQFISMPSTSIPNDQEAYMNWLYRTPGKTCKEGNTDVCVFDTGPAGYPWRELK